MKRGLLKAYLDSNSARAQASGLRHKDGEKKRKPSRIEERIRFRRQLRLNNNNIVKSAKDPRENEEDSKTSCSSSTSSSEINSMQKYRDSKQRVDLLELDQSNRKPMMNSRCKKSKILFKEKINSILMNNHRPRVKQRAKSAPCTPLFQIKCPKSNNFVDYKIVQKDCIDDTEEDKPIGNKLLISVMKESIDKLQAGLKSAEDDQGNDKKAKEEEKPEVGCSPGILEASDQAEERLDEPDQETRSEVCEKPAGSNDCSELLKELENLNTQKSRTRCHRHCCLPRVSQLDETSTKIPHPLSSSTNGKLSRRISSPRNCSCSCSCRGRGQCLRSRSSPRRVTFCVPSLIPEEGNCSDADADKNPDDIERRSQLLEGSKFCRCKVKYSARNRGVGLCKRRDEDTGAKESGSKTSLTSDKDWNTDYDDNKMRCISFPKETRLAMNVLMHSRDNAITTRSIHPGRKTQRCLHNPLREVKVLNKPDLGIFETAGEKAMHVATYAQALAVFQRTSDPLPAGGRCVKKRQILSKWNHNRVQNLEKNRVHSTRNSEDNRNLNIQEVSSCCTTKPFITMQTNGSENGSSENGVDRTGWTVGLINGRFKYLTAETFGFKINANGASLKKKQLWTLEGSEHQVFLRSHLDRYLAVDQFGNVTCEAEDTADPGCAFQIQVAADGSGRWALKNIQRGYFLGSSQDELKCTAKVPGDAEYWLVHLAARPQVNLRSAGRKRFAHLSAAQDEIHVDAPVPWGEDTLFTLEFRPAAMPDAIEGNGDVRREVRSEAGIGGHYALHTCNNKYLARDGKLLDSCTRDCLYAAEFHAGMLALRDVSGAYLAPIGSKAVLKSRSNTVTRDELFSLEDSLPQASFVAALNQRYVSVKQGVDVTANQDEISGHETFQLEFDRATKRWYLRTMQDRYWTLEAGGGIQASDHKRSSNALFDLVWQPTDGTVALRANNGKFLATKRSGHLYANADSPGDSEASKFYFYLMNRPVLVLRCEQGFVGLKSNASPKLECNKASYETIRVERCDRGIVRFKGQNGKYWHADSEGVTSDADVPSDGFYLELREPSRICIKSTDGRYLSAGKNGVFRLGDTDYESATKWEF